MWGSDHFVWLGLGMCEDRSSGQERTLWVHGKLMF